MVTGFEGVSRMNAFWHTWRREIIRGAVLFFGVNAIGLCVRYVFFRARQGVLDNLPVALSELKGLRNLRDLGANFDPDLNSGPRHAAETWTYRAKLAPKQWLWIRNANGSVRVEPAAGDSVEITAVKSYGRSDPHTVRLHFKQPTPFWAGKLSAIIPKHLFERYKGVSSRDTPENLKPVGTGPYRFVDFKPGDLIKGERNPAYHLPDRPYFDTIELKGGGDAVSAARAVIQTGEYDFAWNLQVEDEILLRLENGGNAKGRVQIIEGGNIEHIELNSTDPWTDVDGERSSIKTTHPLLGDQAVRKALALLIDRASVEKHIYGRTGIATGNFINGPKRFVSNNTQWEFSVDKANQLLDQAGWKRGSDGIRAKDGKQLKLVFQTSTNAPRQKTQAIVKQACQKAGMEVELKAVTASVYFSADEGNPDTSRKFYTDLQMFTSTTSVPDPEAFMRAFASWEVASKENKWQGRNITRWRNDRYDKAFREAEGELDPVKRAALFITMNDLVVGDPAVIPVVYRPAVTAMARNLRARGGWGDNSLGELRNWYREI